jgi:hypothetical protein
VAQEQLWIPRAARGRIWVPFRGLKSAKTLLSELRNLGLKALLLLGSQLRCERWNWSQMWITKREPLQSSTSWPSTEADLFAYLSKIEHAGLPIGSIIRSMTSKAKVLTPEEFASLLTVGNTSAVTCPPAVIPAAHSARLIALGYMADISGRLRMTTPGRIRINAGHLVA